MIIEVAKEYRLKPGAEIVFGRADYGLEDLQIIAVDTDDSTVQVRPAGFSGGVFWCNADDLVPYGN